MKKKIVILGSTGSIGTQALTVIQEHENLFEVEVLTANNNSSLLINQAKKINPKAVVIANKEKYLEVKTALVPYLSILENKAGPKPTEKFSTWTLNLLATKKSNGEFLGIFKLTKNGCKTFLKNYLRI